MAPLPQNNTDRVIVDYTTGAKAHKLSARFSGSATISQALTALAAFLDTLQPILVGNWAILGVRFQQQGGDISVPVSPGPLAGFSGGNAAPSLNLREEPRALTFVGRSGTSGRKVSLAVYGANFTTPSNYRYTSDEATDIEAAVEVLNDAQANNVFCVIDGSDALWYPYADVNYNSYWETQARRG